MTHKTIHWVGEMQNVSWGPRPALPAQPNMVAPRLSDHLISHRTPIKRVNMQSNKPLLSHAFTGYLRSWQGIAMGRGFSPLTKWQGQKGCHALDSHYK
ncbi:hypothetical protein FKM82_022272 [Ascaphus truei]